MQLAPATLSTITAILSAQGITATGAQLSVLLAPLTGETPLVPTFGLRADETVMLRDNHAGEDEFFDTVEAAANFVRRKNEDRNHGDDVSDWQAWAVRDIEIAATQTLTVTLG